MGLAQDNHGHGCHLPKPAAIREIAGRMPARKISASNVPLIAWRASWLKAETTIPRVSEKNKVVTAPV